MISGSQLSDWLAIASWYQMSLPSFQGTDSPVRLTTKTLLTDGHFNKASSVFNLRGIFDNSVGLSGEFIVTDTVV